MRYLGGKARIACYLAPVVLERARGRHIWEPFVGGANMTPHLKSAVASDAHPALISLYQAVVTGWTPPENVSQAEYDAAKQLPDSNPRKAFCGFACSFGGKWFGGLTKPNTAQRIKDSALGRERYIDRNPIRAGAQSLIKLRKIDTIWLQADFCAVEPFDAPGWAIYADPPYEGTTGYGADFDHALFWKRCQQWAALGTPVLVSEYACPVPHKLLWERERHLEMHTTKGESKRMERLFEVLP